MVRAFLSNFSAIPAATHHLTVRGGGA